MQREKELREQMAVLEKEAHASGQGIWNRRKRRSKRKSNAEQPSMSLQGSVKPGCWPSIAEQDRI